MRRLAPFLLLVSAWTLAAQAPVKGPEELRIFFGNHCVKCHGVDGTAVDAAGKKLGGRDFTDATWRAEVKDPELVKTIRKGLFFGLKMPAFKDQLSEADALAMVQEVLRKTEKGKVVAPAGEAPR